MELSAGAVMLVLGTLILVFGSAPTRADATTNGARARRLALDLLFRWAPGVACLVFGLELVFGKASFG
jgi:hypothetical protein